LRYGTAALLDCLHAWAVPKHSTHHSGNKMHFYGELLAVWPYICPAFSTRMMWRERGKKRYGEYCKKRRRGSVRDDIFGSRNCWKSKYRYKDKRLQSILNTISCFKLKYKKVRAEEVHKILLHNPNCNLIQFVLFLWHRTQ
jgi:hypothetical protein